MYIDYLKGLCDVYQLGLSAKVMITSNSCLQSPVK